MKCDEYVAKIEYQQEENCQLSTTLDQLKSQHSNLNTTHERLLSNHEKLLHKLKSAPEKKHNERGAGRKQSISIFHIKHVVRLLNQGKSAREISTILIPQTDSSWKAEKVRYVKKRYLEQDEDGQWVLVRSEKH